MPKAHVLAVRRAERPTARRIQPVTASLHAVWLLLCALLLQWSGAEATTLASASAAALSGSHAAFDPALTERTAPSKAVRLTAPDPRHPATLDVFDPPGLIPGVRMAELVVVAATAPFGARRLLWAPSLSHQPRGPPARS